MKKFVAITFLLSIFTSFSVFASNELKTSTQNTVSKVEVYYFHFTRRCTTCQAVENESKKAIEALYPAQIKKGIITFKSVNLDDKSSATDVKKCKADGQSLLVISGNKRSDLTDSAFMFATNSPDKLKAKLKETIDTLLK